MPEGREASSTSASAVTPPLRCSGSGFYCSLRGTCNLRVLAKWTYLNQCRRSWSNVVLLGGYSYKKSTTRNPLASYGFHIQRLLGCFTRPVLSVASESILSLPTSLPPFGHCVFLIHFIGYMPPSTRGEQDFLAICAHLPSELKNDLNAVADLNESTHNLTSELSRDQAEILERAKAKYRQVFIMVLSRKLNFSRVSLVLFGCALLGKLK